MRIILSRKGFDSTSGGVPSPIFNDETMISLPIPRKSNLMYRQIRSIRSEFQHLGNIVEPLTEYRLSDSCCAHLDPDLDSRLIDRETDWRGIFGQNGNSQRHLAQVKKGDLFLFFGLFRKVGLGGKTGIRYRRGEPPMHVIYGWLRVGDVYRIPEQKDEVPVWANYHPHIQFQEIESAPNVIYVAAEKLGPQSDLSGWGVFPRFREELCLTDLTPTVDGKGSPRGRLTRWRLPAWLYPWQEPKRTPLSQFPNPKDWSVPDGKWTVLDTSKGRKGQESILQCNEYPEALTWAINLIETCRR